MEVTVKVIGCVRDVQVLVVVNFGGEFAEANHIEPRRSSVKHEQSVAVGYVEGAGLDVHDGESAFRCQGRWDRR